MELARLYDDPTQVTLHKNILEKIVHSAQYSSSEIVDFINERAQQNNIPLIAENIKSFLKLDQERIDRIFINNIKNDQIRHLMLSLGANINTQNQSGSNCLWYITKPALLNELIDKGADVNHVDRLGDNPLKALTKCKNHRRISAARILLTRGVHLNPNNEQSLFNAMSECITSDAGLEAVKFLLEYKININTKQYGYCWNNTLLMLAISAQNTELVGFLLKNNANSNIPNDDHFYPIHWAVGRPNVCYDKPAIPEIVALLLQYDADPNIQYPDQSMFPLDSAKQHGESKIVEELKKYGAKQFV